MSDGRCHCRGCDQARIQGAEDLAQRIRELHKRVEGIGVWECAVCVNDNLYLTEPVEYPCDTIKALEGK